MIFDWYRIFNKAEFEATGLPSRTFSMFLTGVGLATILVTKGNALSITYAGKFISLGMSGMNPYAFDGLGIYLDAKGDVWMGILKP